jgi:hypothetical protein
VDGIVQVEGDPGVGVSRAVGSGGSEAVVEGPGTAEAIVLYMAAWLSTAVCCGMAAESLPFATSAARQFVRLLSVKRSLRMKEAERQAEVLGVERLMSRA